MSSDFIVNEYTNLINSIGDDFIKSICSKFEIVTFLSFEKNPVKTDENYIDALFNFLNKHQLIIYYLPNHINNIKAVVCVEGKCVIFEKFDIINFESTLMKIKGITINVSEPDQNLSEEISSIERTFSKTIKQNPLFRIIMRPILAFIIRRFFYPTYYFKKPDFFTFNKKYNKPNFINAFNSWFQSKSCKEMMDDNIEQFFENKDEEKPILLNFKEDEFIKLRTIFNKQLSIYYLVIHKDSLYLFLMKKYSTLEKNKFKLHEISFCENYSHHCFTKVYGFLKNEGQVTGIIYEYLCNDNLTKFYKSNKHNNEIFKLMTSKRVFEGINYLQSKSLIHRDLKPDNILIDHDYRAYISDYETIRKVTDQNEEYTYDIGSSFYGSPEQLNGDNISPQTDIYSYGLILKFIYNQKISSKFKSLIDSCTMSDPNKRISIKGITNFLSDEIKNFNDLNKISLSDNIHLLSQYLHENISILKIKGWNQEQINDYFYKSYILFLSEFKKNEEKKSFALNNLGNLYMNGKGLEKNYSKAKKYYHKAEKLNNSYATNSIGNFYKTGILGEKNYLKAIEYYRRASMMENPESFYNLGFLYLTGKGFKRDLVKAYEYFMKGADLKNVNSYRLLALLHLYGEEPIEQNSQKAKEYYDKAIKLNDSNSIVSKALLYYYGDSVEKDYLKARELFLLAANKNVANAFYNLGKMYKRGDIGKRDYDKAIHYFKIAARLNQPDSYYYLGKLYFKGQGVPQDYKMAKSYYEIGSELNEPYSSYKLGIMYENGIGVKQDYKKAEQYFKKAGENHYFSGVFKLGTYYNNGDIFQIDIDKAISYFEMCIQTKKEKYLLELNEYFNIKRNFEHYPAYNELGLIYIISDEKRNLNAAVDFIRIAAHSEYPFGQNNYGLLNQIYLNNLDEARYMYERASKHNFAPAEYNFGHIYEEKGNLVEAYKLYERASKHEDQEMIFHSIKRYDKRLKYSIIFITTLAELKLIHYYLSLETYNSDKVQIYFNKILTKFKKYLENEYFPLVIGEKCENIFHLICNTFFNNTDDTNIDETIQYEKYCLQKKHKQQTIENINDMKNIFEYKSQKLLKDVLIDRNIRERFMLNIAEMIDLMNSILYKPPYLILFGRIQINKKIPEHLISSNKIISDINNEFYNGFDINIEEIK